MENKWLPRPFPWGKPIDFWLRNMDYVKDTIRKFRLKPIKDEFLIPGGYSTGVKRTKSSAAALGYDQYDVPPWIWKYGGRRAAHMHLGDKIYILSDRQWAFFSNSVIQGFMTRLKGVKTVGFDQMMELNDVMEDIIPGGR